MDWPRVLELLEADGAPTVYVIRSAFVDADFSGVERKVLPIASRSIQSMIRTQGLGDLYQIYALCLRDGSAFRLAYIPAVFTAQPVEDFDPVYMSSLFAHAYDAARRGYDWRTAPPGFRPAERAATRARGTP